MTSATFDRAAEAPALASMSLAPQPAAAQATVAQSAVNDWTPPTLPGAASLLRMMGGVLLVVLLSFFLLNLL